MSVEIERKFLVKNDSWREQGTTTLLRQGYLSSNKDRIVRVRIEGEQGTLTIKSKAQGLTRGEWEYVIPFEEAKNLLDHVCERPLLEKTRTRITQGELVWEVDAFLGDNLGLVVAEVELESESQKIALPDWIGEEVSHDARYFNSNLLTHPYKDWK